jgi:thioredoxin-related protein
VVGIALFVQHRLSKLDLLKSKTTMSLDRNLCLFCRRFKWELNDKPRRNFQPNSKPFSGYR